MAVIGERAIRAADFAGLVPASRGAHCRPLHPRLASLCPPGKNGEANPRLGRRPRSERSNLDRRRPTRPIAGPFIDMFKLGTIIDSRRESRGGVAII